jgi:hypothetical protein
MNFMGLNRRHKVCLFLTLTITAIALLDGAPIRVGLGIALLGSAIAWVVGSIKAEHVLSGLAWMKPKIRSIPRQRWFAVPVSAIFLIVGIFCIVNIPASFVDREPGIGWLERFYFLTGGLISFTLVWLLYRESRR